MFPSVTKTLLAYLKTVVTLLSLSYVLFHIILIRVKRIHFYNTIMH